MGKADLVCKRVTVWGQVYQKCLRLLVHLDGSAQKGDFSRGSSCCPPHSVLVADCRQSSPPGLLHSKDEHSCWHSEGRYLLPPHYTHACTCAQNRWGKGGGQGREGQQGTQAEGRPSPLSDNTMAPVHRPSHSPNHINVCYIF